MRKFLSFLAAIAVLGVAAPLAAQVKPPMPIDGFTVSPGGVDLRTGLYVTDKVDLTIGDPARGGLEFRRTTRNIIPMGSPGWVSNRKINPLGQFSHNWIMYVIQRADTPVPCCTIQHMDVFPTAEGLSDSFSADRSGSGTTPFSFTQRNTSHYAELTADNPANPGVYTYSLSGGRKIVFGTVQGSNKPSATEVRFANGVVQTLNYDTSGNLWSVVSNAGYALVLEYTTVSGGAYVSKVCALNLAFQTLPSGGSCPSGVPTVSYTYAAASWGSSGEVRMTSMTDVAGQIWTNSLLPIVGTYDAEEKFYAPGQSTPYLTNVRTGDWTSQGSPDGIVSKQTFADGHSYTYHWTSQTYGTEYECCQPVEVLYSTGYAENATTDNLNTTVAYASYYSPGYSHQPIVSAGPEQVTDPLGRTTSYYYCVSCGQQSLYSKTLPQGMKVAIGYDPYWNVTSHTYTPNTGTSAPTITDTAHYNCTTLAVCDKPDYAIDPKGNHTDYTYDTNHGGPLTVSAPADSNGVRPVKRYIYIQRNAWISNGTGGYVQSTPAIWLLSEERSCKTTSTVGNACAGGSADEVVTNYDYGPNSGPNNLLVRGVAVTAGGQTLRTCYTYDTSGRRLSETKPLGTGATCP